MKYASADLIDEHEGILIGLKILEKITENIKMNLAFERKDIGEMINFLKLFADKCHHGKEEGLLFPAMERAGIIKENGLIGEMLKEHELGRSYIHKMQEADHLEELDIDKYVEASMKYIDLLRVHIEKENTILFPMGDNAIPKKVQEALLEQFETHEATVMGEGTHEKLHLMLHVFQSKYLHIV